MRSLRKVALTTAVFMLCALFMQVGVFAIDNYASWAEPYVMQADALGLLTENARKDYVKALTREEFCELVVNMFEKRVGNQIEITSRPFADTDNPMVYKAYSIGIVKGTSETTFSPNDAVTREQAAVMLVNTVRIIEEARGVKIYTEYTEALPFQDNAQISEWALESVRVAYANGLMQGDGENVRPLANISCQECIILVLNAYNKEEAVPQDVGGQQPVGSATPRTTAQPSQTPSPGQQTAQPAPTPQPTAGGQPATTSQPVSSGSLTVTIDGGNVPLKVNETTQLTYSVTGDADQITGVSWSSSANSVATIDQNGNVKAIGKGSAKITLSVRTDSKTYTATKTIHVDPPLVALNSVTIANPVRTIKYGDSSTFNVQLSPSTATVESVTWSSSNTGVATIDARGKATSVGAGSTTIKVTVKAKDGTTKEATATLTVTAAVAVTSIKFSNNVSDPMFVGTTRSTSATLGPSGAVAVTKTWKSSNPSVASVDNSGRLSAISAGTTTITLTVSDRSGAEFSNSFTLTVKDNYVSSFTLGKSTYDISIGETVYPELILSPPTAVVKSVSFSFSGPSGVLSTSNSAQSITGKKEGSGVLSVKVTFEDRTTHTAQATVNVLPMSIESVSFTVSKPVLKVGGRTTDAYTNVSYRITPSNASYDSLEFFSSDPSVATVANSSSTSTSGSRRVDAVGEGSCTITMSIRFKDGTVRNEYVDITVIAN